MIEPIRKVLVVDDSDKKRRDVHAVLIELGFKKDQIEDATDGREAYDKAQEKEYQFIIMDKNMLGCDGIKATRATRKKGLNRETTIIAYTSDITPNTTERELEEYKDLGFTYALTKDTDILKATLSDLLNKHK